MDAKVLQDILHQRSVSLLKGLKLIWGCLIWADLGATFGLIWGVWGCFEAAVWWQWGVWVWQPHWRGIGWQLTIFRLVLGCGSSFWLWSWLFANCVFFPWCFLLKKENLERREVGLEFASNSSRRALCTFRGSLNAFLTNFLFYPCDEWKFFCR